MSGKIAERAMRAWGWSRDSSEDEWRKARADALKPITMHECRHTYASFLMAAGYNLREIMEFMGHGDLATTDRYVKVLPQPAEADRSAASTRTFARSIRRPDPPGSERWI